MQADNAATRAEWLFLSLMDVQDLARSRAHPMPSTPEEALGRIAHVAGVALDRDRRARYEERDLAEGFPLDHPEHPMPTIEQDEHSGLWYKLDAAGNRLHGPYQERPV